MPAIANPPSDASPQGGVRLTLTLLAVAAMVSVYSAWSGGLDNAPNSAEAPKLD